MPEGHTLHRLAAEHRRVFGGRPVRAASPQGRFAPGARLIDGRVLVDAQAHGKHLLCDFGDDRWLHIHLGLYGTMRFGAAPAPAPVGQVRLRLESVGDYADLRGPTACEVIDPAARTTLLARLGPDPLAADADEGRAWTRIHRSRTAVAALLIDQSVIAGVGNVYRAEVLFRHGIAPTRPGTALARTEWLAVWSDLVSLMHEGVATGRIDTVRPEHTPEAMGRPPRRDDHGGEVYVYRRTGQPCHVCGTPVAAGSAAGRNLFWCPVCQNR